MINLINGSETSISMFRSPRLVRICFESLLVSNKSHSHTARAENRYFFFYVLLQGMTLSFLSETLDDARCRVSRISIEDMLLRAEFLNSRLAF